MNPESTTIHRIFGANALAIFSFATFWAIPFSPFVAMAALHQTRSTTGWARRLSVAAAVLCSVYTVAIAALVYCLTLFVLTGGS